MNAVWAGVAVASVAAYLVKLTGLSVPRSVLDRPAVQRVAVALPVGMLAALVLTQTFTDGERLVLDARAAGVAVAALMVWRRLPLLLAITAAAATAAVVRAVAG